MVKERRFITSYSLDVDGNFYASANISVSGVPQGAGDNNSFGIPVANFPIGIYNANVTATNPDTGVSCSSNISFEIVTGGTTGGD